jgi:hypothetical protein
MMPSGRILQLGLLLVVLAEYKHWHHIQHNLLVVGNQPAKTNKLVKKQSRVRRIRWPMASIFTVGPVKHNKDRPTVPAIFVSSNR